jgi:hypothetical protein
MLKFSKGNAKLGKHTLIFNLPAGKTCPAAKFCKSSAVVDVNGKRSIQDGPDTEFRCFAASAEVQYNAVYASRKHNFDLINEIIIGHVKGYKQHSDLVDLIDSSLQHHRTKKTSLVRIHESGDFFSQYYLAAWIDVANRNPDLKFYCYSKSLNLFLDIVLPENFYMTASYGGRHDALIDQGYFKRYCVVCKTQRDADLLGLEVDHDDSHCFYSRPFALLVHGTQPKGSEWSKAIQERKKAKEFVGYSK